LKLAKSTGGGEERGIKKESEAAPFERWLAPHFHRNKNVSRDEKFSNAL